MTSYRIKSEGIDLQIVRLLSGTYTRNAGYYASPTSAECLVGSVKVN